MDAIPKSVAITPPVTGPLHPAAPGMPDHKGFTFSDFLDVINPLQHLPVIGTLYRRLTGDKMSPTAEIAGGALFGGAIGAAASIVDVLWTQATGKDLGESVMSWLGLGAAKSPTQFAANPAAKKATEIPPAAAPNPAPEAPLARAATPAGPPALTAKIPSTSFQMLQARRALLAPAPATTAVLQARRVMPAVAAPPAAGAASPAPRLMPAEATVSAGIDLDLPALIQAMQKQGVDPAVALRAAAAYRSAIGQKTLELAPAD